MKRIALNHDWLFARGTITMMELFTGGGEKIQKMDLPHDAMISRERTPDTANAHQTGFYPGGEYTYLKQWEVPSEWEGKTVALEFEGVADTGRIYVNGDLVAEHYNPYTGIFADVSAFLKYGQVNELKVEVRSVEQSSRWYSGAGLYRPVCAWIGGKVHIPAQGTRITTLEADTDYAVMEVTAPLNNRGLAACKAQVKIALSDQEGRIVSKNTVYHVPLNDGCPPIQKIPVSFWETPFHSHPSFPEPAPNYNRFIG